MKSRLIMLGGAAFLSQATIEAKSFEDPFYQNFMEVQEEVDKTIQAVLSVPSNACNFENTLKPWMQLSAQLVRHRESLEGTETSSILKDLPLYFMQNAQLSNIVLECAEKVLNDQNSNPVQCYIAGRLLNRTVDGYFPGKAQEKSSHGADFTVFTLESLRAQKKQTGDISEQILSNNIDIACIPEINLDDLNDLYEVLQGIYAHFLYIDEDAPMLNGSSNGYLIVSKYPLDQVHWNKSADGNAGVVDFVVKNADMSLGHVYAVTFQAETSDSTQVLKLTQVIEKMHSDFLKSEELIPFFLCGDLSILQASEESKMLVDTYFLADRSVLGYSGPQKLDRLGCLLHAT